MVATGSNAYTDQRAAPREEVYHRTRASIEGRRAVALQVVDISATGFMARTEAELAPGTMLNIRLPLIGERPAEVRWALAGRIGCQFARAIDLDEFLNLLGSLARQPK